jgi:hypothetical protein
MSYNNAAVGNALDSKVHALGSRGINKINSDKGKEKELFVIIMINQIIGLIAA